MVRQLKEAPDSLRVECFALHGRGASASELLGAVRANPALLCDGQNRELRSFRLTMAGPMGTKRGDGRGSFVNSVLDPLNAFYVGVVQHLKTWTAPPPKLRPQENPDAEPEVTPALISTSLSSQDGRETASIPPGSDELIPATSR
jgi:hypothetical protein